MFGLYYGPIPYGKIIIIVKCWQCLITVVGNIIQYIHLDSRTTYQTDNRLQMLIKHSIGINNYFDILRLIKVIHILLVSCRYLLNDNIVILAST